MVENNDNISTDPPATQTIKNKTYFSLFQCPDSKPEIQFVQPVQVSAKLKDKVIFYKWY